MSGLVEAPGEGPPIDTDEERMNTDKINEFSIIILSISYRRSSSSI
jgi:hypothetical protein